MKKLALAFVSIIVLLIGFYLLARPVDHDICIWQNYTYRVLDDGSIAILRYENKDSAKDLFVSGYVNGLKVKCVESNAFDCQNVNSITISDNIDILSENAFLHCDDVFFLSIGSSLKTSRSFSQLNNLQTLTISYGEDGFMHNYASVMDTPYYASIENIKTLKINSGVRYLSDYAFSQMSNLEDVILPDTIESIGKYCFAQSNLTNVTFPYSLCSVGEKALANDCNNISGRIILPQNISYIGEDALSSQYTYYSYANSKTSLYLLENNLDYNPVEFAFEKQEYAGELGEKRNIAILNASEFDNDILYSSSDQKVVTIDNEGNIQAISTGVALISARTSTAYATTKVSVVHSSNERAVYKLLNLHGQLCIDGNELFNNYNANTKMSYTVNDENIVKVTDDGIVSGVELGVGEITVHYGLWKAKVMVEVSLFVQSISTGDNYYNLTKGQSFQLNPSVYPKNASNPTLTYSSSNPEIAIVSKDGEVTGMKCGRCKVTISANDGSNIKQTIIINVSEATISIERTSIIMMPGKSYQMHVLCNDGSKLRFNSLNSDVVSIDINGLMRAHSEGYCMIEVQSVNGSAYSCFECRVTNAIAYGMDISQWNGRYNTVDTFKAAKNYGIDFVYIRAGYGNGSEDKSYQRNYYAAKEAGLDVGAYHYIVSLNTQDAYQEARYMLTLLRGKQFEYPIMVDIEDNAQKELDGETFNAIIKTYCDVLQQAGYKTIVYSYASLLTKTDGSQEYWMAHWGVLYPSLYRGNYTIWQYTSNGMVDGFAGRIDLNVCFYDYPTYIKENHLNGY